MKTNKTRTPNDAITVQSAARAWAADNLPGSVRVTCGQGVVYLSTTGRDTAVLVQAKRNLGTFLQATFTGRRFLHQRHQGAKVWTWGWGEGPAWRANGLRVGIKIELTEAEHTAVLLGSWKNIEGTVQS